MVENRLFYRGKFVIVLTKTKECGIMAKVWFFEEFKPYLKGFDSGEMIKCQCLFLK